MAKSKAAHAHATLQALNRAMEKVALTEMYRLVQAILTRQPNIASYDGGMGSWCFWDTNGEQVETLTDRYHQRGAVVYTFTPKAWARDLHDFLDAWDHKLGVSDLAGRIDRDTTLAEVLGDLANEEETPQRKEDTRCASVRSGPPRNGSMSLPRCARSS